MALKEESLKMAIDLEKEGNKYYAKHAKEVEDQLSKKVLKSLAEWELEHIEAIKRIAEGKKVSADELTKVDMEAKTREVFEEFAESEKDKWKAQNTEIYDHALELEEKLYHLYEDLKEDSEDEEETEFFEALMGEENKHYETLANVLYYYTDSVRWISEEEGEIWGWMNV
jgi:rubrerythrin